MKDTKCHDPLLESFWRWNNVTDYISKVSAQRCLWLGWQAASRLWVTLPPHFTEHMLPIPLHYTRSSLSLRAAGEHVLTTKLVYLLVIIEMKLFLNNLVCCLHLNLVNPYYNSKTPEGTLMCYHKNYRSVKKNVF